MFATSLQPFLLIVCLFEMLVNAQLTRDKCCTVNKLVTEVAQSYPCAMTREPGNYATGEKQWTAKCKYAGPAEFGTVSVRCLGQVCQSQGPRMTMATSKSVGGLAVYTQCGSVLNPSASITWCPTGMSADFGVVNCESGKTYQVVAAVLDANMERCL